VKQAAKKKIPFKLKSYMAAVLALIIALGSIAGAWYIEIFLEVKPCKLCLEQRYSYYIGIPLIVLSLWPLVKTPEKWVGHVFLALAGLVFLAGGVLAIYHSGVEWGFWPGPTDCTGSIEQPAALADFLKQLETVKIVRCDEVAMRIFGQSLAVWNAVISAAISVISGYGVWLKRSV
jgi:disulfide bond formation protein DsbB